MKNIFKAIPLLLWAMLFPAAAENADASLSGNPALIKASAVIILIWFALALMMLAVNLKIKKLRKKIDEL